jgi:hypothetical protein
VFLVTSPVSVVMVDEAWSLLAHGNDPHPEAVADAAATGSFTIHQQALSVSALVWDIMDAEYQDWLLALSFIGSLSPTPFLEGIPVGLPAGWQVRAQTRGPQENLWGGPRALLVSRKWGGWAIMHRYDNHQDGSVSRASLHSHDATIMGLYDQNPSSELIRDFIAKHYNHDDPAEAAEVTLVGLGARPQLMPAALA